MSLTTPPCRLPDRAGRTAGGGMVALVRRLPLLAIATAWAVSGCALPHPTEPRIQHLVAEDDQVRVDEWRVRGQTQRLTVQPKGGQAYDIVPPKAPGDAAGQSAAGQRVWPVLRF